MKKIAFAYSTYVYDFSSLEEARKFVYENLGKKGVLVNCYDGSADSCISNNDYCYSVTICKSIGKYNSGW